MLYKKILIVGSNIISYEIISYLYTYYNLDNASIYIYDDSNMYKRDYYRLSWWLNNENSKDSASKICEKRYNKCRSISKDVLNKFGISMDYPDVAIFTSSHIMKGESSFNKLVGRLIDNNVKIIMAMNHHLYGYYNNNISKLKDDIKCNTYSLNEYVRNNDKINNDNLVKDYINYIYSCNDSIDPDNINETFKYANMNSIYYPLCTILAMMVIKDIVEGIKDTSIVIDWSLLRNSEIYLKRTEEDDYKYIESCNWMNNLRQSRLLVIVDSEDVFDIMMKQLYNIGYFKYSKGEIYVLCENNYNYENNKIKYVNDINNVVISNIDHIICISDNYSKKIMIDKICIYYDKPCIYMHKYDSVPFIEIVNSVPNITETYNESNYMILDKSELNRNNISVIDWRINMGMAMIIVLWMIYMKISNIDNIRFKKYMSSRIDNKCSWNISKRCKEYYNNSYNGEYNRIIYTIPDKFSKWTKINVYHNNDSVDKLSGLLSHLQDEHGLVPYKIMYNDEILYDKEKYMENNKITNKLLKPWIYKRTSERYKVVAILKLYCTDSNGNELLCPPIYYHCCK